MWSAPFSVEEFAANFIPAFVVDRIIIFDQFLSRICDRDVTLGIAERELDCV